MVKELKKKVKGYIACDASDRTDYFLREAFKGEVSDKEIRFPKELGAVHPFNFEGAEEIYKNVGIIGGAIDKYVDSIVGDFTVKTNTKKEKENDNVQAIIDAFVKDSELSVNLRPWIREALSKGNGFMELDLKESKVRPLNANNIFIKRNVKGKVLKYNQWKGKMQNFKPSSSKVIPFEPHQIAHLPTNQIAEDAYGLGFIAPNMKQIDLLVGNEIDLHKLISRKAGAPIHVKVGAEGESVQPEDIDDFKSKLQFMQTRTEWVTDGNIKMDFIDFKDVGKNFTDTINHDVQMILFGIQIPAVLMGMDNIPEGLAKVQLEAFQRKIRAIQEAIEVIIEQQIFKPLLVANGFDAEVEFIWNLPGEDEINNRVQQIKDLLGGMIQIDENLRRMLQLELARNLNIENAEDYLRQPEVGLDDQMDEEKKQLELDAQKDTKPENPERKKEESIAQPEVPRAKPAANQKAKLHMKGCGCGQQLTESMSGDMTIKEWVNLQEAKGLNYKDYTANILSRLRTDQFDSLKAISEADISNGLLETQEVEKLRIILKNGFKKNQTIKQIENEIKDNLMLRDRLNDGKVVASANNRPNSIARTETVRLANMGILDTYNENDIKKVRFLAALSDRTCPICEELNAQVYNINEANGVIPVHVACRCTWTPVVE